ncbi:FAD binding domain-containing protein, partial [Klebsiella pneumoniae]|uniref:FAD binding domain-containing protein n=1 Tax=Klebsiella pneumoniae TaxID=573 RepID=UPI0030131901
AGGQTLLPVMKQRLASPSDVIDLAKIDDLIGCFGSGNGIVIRAATTHAEVSQDPTVRKGVPALCRLAALIGDPAVRNRGTLG